MSSPLSPVASSPPGQPLPLRILAGRDTWNYSKAPAEVLERVKAIARVCDAHGVPLAAAAMQFPLAHPLVAAVGGSWLVDKKLMAAGDWAGITKLATEAVKLAGAKPPEPHAGSAVRSHEHAHEVRKYHL